jgi:altronate hydrolase
LNKLRIKTMNNTTLLLHPSDNVGVALSDLESGQKVSLNDLEIEIQQFVAAKHKFAIHDLAKGDDILMYGTIVGEATLDIPKGNLSQQV